jgi:ribosomal 50S subunit-associated protein YjgA (DUF615 family)
MIIHVNGVDREATKDEIAEIEATRAEAQAEANAAKQVESEKQALKTATLKKLGLTADEVAALLS